MHLRLPTVSRGFAYATRSTSVRLALTSFPTRLDASCPPFERPPRRKRLYRNVLSALIAFPLGYTLWQYVNRNERKKEPELSPYTFTPYTLVRKEKVGETSSLFALRAPQGHQDQIPNGGIIQETWRKGVLWSVQIRQPELQIARSYTPLPPFSLDGEAQNERDLIFWIRREEKGEVSGYLHRLREGDNVDIRGPAVEYPNLDGVSECLFLVGGTGVVTALQGLHALTRREGEGLRMGVMWACRRREDCAGGVSDWVEGQPDRGSVRWKSWFGSVKREVREGDKEKPANVTAYRSQDRGQMVQRLEDLKNHTRQKQDQYLTVQYFVDQERTFIRKESIAGHTQTLEHGSDKKTGPRRRLILVSGPDGFVEYIAGPKKWQGGKEVQGPLGGLLATLDLKGWEVWKL